MTAATKKAPSKKPDPQVEKITISAPSITTAEFKIKGTDPYVQCKFSQKALNEMRETQSLGSVAAKGRARKPKDFEGLFEASIHYSKEGWAGIPASAFRTAMVDACRLAGFNMRMAKMSVFVVADGYDATEGVPLVRITKGKPRHVEHAVRLQGVTTDIRVRAMWDPGWEAKVSIKYDSDQFDLSDVSNLLLRVGMQVGIGEGRPFSKNSTGMGWGTFELDR